jgi:hypothetical protein
MRNIRVLVSSVDLLPPQYSRLLEQRSKSGHARLARLEGAAGYGEPSKRDDSAPGPSR